MKTKTEMEIGIDVPVMDALFAPVMPVNKTNTMVDDIIQAKSTGPARYIPTAQISMEGFDVRLTSLLDDRVEYFKALYRENKPVPDIIVEEKADGTFLLIEGRHRHTGCVNADGKEIKAIVLRGLTPFERRLIALRGNMYGALPHSKQDMRMNVYEFLLLGKTAKEIRVCCDGWPKAQLEKSIRHAERDYHLHCLREAGKWVMRKGNPLSIDASIAAATEKWPLKAVDLRRYLNPAKGKKGKKARTAEGVNLGGHISTEFGRWSTWVNTTMEAVSIKLREGDLESDDAARIFKQMRNLTKSIQKRINLGESKFKLQIFGE
jgi:hypothetical protein